MIFIWIRRWWTGRKLRREAVETHRALIAERGERWWENNSL